MIAPLDPLGPSQRLDPAASLWRGPVIEAEQARALGLRNGQVVQAVVTAGPSALQVLWPQGLRQGLPTALQAFPLPSQWRWAEGTRHDLMAVLMPGGHIMLRPIRNPAMAAAPAATPGTSAYGAAGSVTGAASSAAASTGASTATAAAPPGLGTAGSVAGAGAGAASGATGAAVAGSASALTSGAAPIPAVRYTLGEAYAAALGAGTLSAGGSAELARLLQQAPAWAGMLAWLQRLSQEDPDESMRQQESPGNPTALARSPLGDMLGGALPRVAGLTSEGLRQAVMRSGMGTEAALWAGVPGLDQDLKVALRRLARQPAWMGTGGESALSRVVDDLERSQLEALSAQMQGQLLWTMALPFGDAGPVALRLFRDRPRPGEEPPPFVVDLHSRHSGLGPLWLRTVVGHDQRLALTMWAERPAVAEQAQAQATELRRSLSSQGLTLAALEIVSGPRPPHEDVFAGETGAR